MALLRLTQLFIVNLNTLLLVQTCSFVRLLSEQLGSRSLVYFITFTNKLAAVKVARTQDGQLSWMNRG